MDITKTFQPIAVNLIDKVFPTAIVYTRNSGSTYDPATGTVTPSATDYNIKAGIIATTRSEQGGVEEIYEITLYIQHTASGLPHTPTTADRITYGGQVWKVVSVAPSYRSAGEIASKIVARAS